jgi:PilZ domain
MLQSKPKRASRKARHHGAWITFDDDIRSYECRVLDVSAGGAKLVADIDAIVGTSFKLSVAPRSLVRKPCEVVWRRGRQLGVKFTDHTKEPPPG